jgi:hypothetical protein
MKSRVELLNSPCRTDDGLLDQNMSEIKQKEEISKPIKLLFIDMVAEGRIRIRTALSLDYTVQHNTKL